VADTAVAAAAGVVAAVAVAAAVGVTEIADKPFTAQSHRSFSGAVVLLCQ
jgi:hypothetical protein